jgi:hypothetical protein
VINILENLKFEKHNFSNETLLLSQIELKKEKEALEKRNLIEQKNFFEKKLIAFELLAKNQYKYFNGYKSFIRDLLR